MFVLKRTNGRDPDFVSLVKNLDADLARRDGEDHSFYSQFNKMKVLGMLTIVVSLAIVTLAVKAFQ